ncbi:MAG: response regulator [bacterium]|nr:response regulator [bacterium]
MKKRSNSAKKRNLEKLFDEKTKSFEREHHRLVKAQEIAHIGAWDINLKNNTITWTKETYKIFDVPICRLITYDFFLNCVYYEDREYVDEKWKAALDGEIYDIEHRVFSNYEIKWVREKAEFTYDKSNKLLSVLGVVTDITEQKRAADKLIISEEKFRNLFNSCPDGICVVGIDSKKIKYINPVLCNKLEYSERELINKNLLYLHPKNAHEHVIKEFDVLVNKKRSLVKNIQCLRKDDSIFYADINTSEVFLEGENNIIGFFRDMTEHIESEEKQKSLERQLLQSQKMETVGLLAGGIAHEFNNILGIMMGLTEILSNEENINKEEKGYLGEIYNQGERAVELINNILTFSHSNERNFIPFQLSDFIKKVVDLIKVLLPSTIIVKRHIKKSSRMIFGNQTQIQQLIINICNNASHAMRKKGGTLHIKLDVVEVDKDGLSIPDLNDGLYFNLSIRDTGHGMSEEVKNKIFLPFYTTKNVGQGTGLGLSVAHGIINNHKGTITVNSELDNGTAFNVYFPIITISEKPEIEKDNAFIHGNENILIVEDEDYLCNTVELSLNKLGYNIIIANDGNEALAIFKSKPDFFDLVYTDQIMPNMTGVELSREIHCIAPETPIILTTGYNDIMNEEALMQYGIVTVLKKPVRLAKLTQVIQKILTDNRGE